MEAAFVNMGRRTSDEDYVPLRNALRRPAVDYLRMFRGDIAMHGAVNPTRRGIEFFGVNYMVFASDAPVGPIRKCIDMIDRVGLDAKAIRKIFVANGERLPGMSLA